MNLVKLGSQVCPAVVVVAVALSSCKTTEEFTRKFGKRVEKSDVRSSFGFESGLWGGQGGGGDETNEKELASRFADKGWKLDEKGRIKSVNSDGTEKTDLFSGKFRDAGKGFDKRDARLKNREVTREIYRTPEYLDRQKFGGKKSAREGKMASRESNFDENRAGESGRSAREAGDDSSGFLNGLNPFRTKSARESGETYRTAANREGSRAQANAAVPNPGAPPRNGNMSRAALTMDDVKKMLSPESFD